VLTIASLSKLLEYEQLENGLLGHLLGHLLLDKMYKNAKNTILCQKVGGQCPPVFDSSGHAKG